MRIKRIYENEIGQGTTRLEKFSKEKRKICELVYEYVTKIKPDILDKDIAVIGVDDIDYYREDGAVDINIYMGYGSHKHVEFRDDNADDLVKFIDKPELFRDAKKYNL